MRRSTIHTQARRATAILVFACGSISTPNRAAAAPEGPLVIVGIDGLTFDLLDPLAAANRVPSFQAMMAAGARAILLSEAPMRSPALWTTIATGQPRSIHRIYDFVTGSAFWPQELRSESQELVTSDMRRSPAIWEMASEAGMRNLVVGWLNTWPAERVNGAMVAPYVALGTRRQTSIKGKIYDDIARQTHPADLFERIQPLVVEAEAVTDAQVAELVDAPADGSPILTGIPRLRRYLYTVRWSIAGASTNVGILEQLLAETEYDLVMTYLDGADTLAHRFWVMRQPLEDIAARLEAHGMDPAWAPELERRFGEVVDNYYVFADELLGRITAAAGPGATIIVISDHGWGSLPGRVKAPYDQVPFDGEHRMEGVLIASGPHIRHGAFASLTLYDIAPTSLFLLGIEPPPEMTGRVAREIMDDCIAADTPAVAVDAHRPTVEPPAGSDPAFTEEEIERLRSLGYVR